MKKTAIVTGSSRGIGYAILEMLGKKGFQVVMVATGTQEKNQPALDSLKQLGISAHYIQANIGDSLDRQKIVTETVNVFGRIDVLVNNAGVAPISRMDLLEMSEDSFDRVIGINTKGNMFLTQAVANQMLKQPVNEGEARGYIVNISSCSSVTSSPSRGEYCISKAGVSMLTTLYADRLAKDGILVNEIRPGVIATDMTSTVQEKYDTMFASGIFPLARWGTPEDVAKAVSVFVDGTFPYTTGNFIDVDGGFHIKRL